MILVLLPNFYQILKMSISNADQQISKLFKIGAPLLKLTPKLSRKKSQGKGEK